jgi:hypothetical protein
MVQVLLQAELEIVMINDWVLLILISFDDKFNYYQFLFNVVIIIIIEFFFHQFLKF